MKKLITLLLMVTIQITFMQKVIASVALLESDPQSMAHCVGITSNAMEMDSVSYPKMKHCPNDCEMMSVISVMHFIDDDLLISLTYSAFSYPDFITHSTYFQPQDLYRPPLFI